jgi:hypothetical protein
MADEVDWLDQIIKSERSSLENIVDDLFNQMKYMRRPYTLSKIISENPNEINELSRFIMSQDNKLRSDSFQYSISRAADRCDDLADIFAEVGSNEQCITDYESETFPDSAGYLINHLNSSEHIDLSGILNQMWLDAVQLPRYQGEDRARTYVLDNGFDSLRQLGEWLRELPEQYEIILREIGLNQSSDFDYYLSDGGFTEFETIVLSGIFGVGMSIIVASDALTSGITSLGTALTQISLLGFELRDRQIISDSTE